MFFLQSITNYHISSTARKLKMKKTPEEIAKEDSRYNAQAIRFVYEGLGYTAKEVATKPTHVSGQTLCEGLRKLALEKWGRLAMLVLNTWQVKTTRDFGEIVYLMIKHEWMSAQPTDSIDDFNDVYDFKTVFKDQFQF
jgi:uncharacterized repeat protein (TIGR04138 family)